MSSTTTAVLPQLIAFNDLLLQSAVRNGTQLNDANLMLMAAANIRSMKLDEKQQNQQQQQQQQQQPNDRYKTELCRPYEESGQCKYGGKCQFAHGKAELRRTQRHPKYKTELCRTFHTTGFCPYGPRCHFVHNDENVPNNNNSSSSSSGSDSNNTSPPQTPPQQQPKKKQQIRSNVDINNNNNNMLSSFHSFHLPLSRTDSLGSCGETSMSTSPSASPGLPIDDVFHQLRNYENGDVFNALPAQIRHILNSPPIIGD